MNPASLNLPPPHTMQYTDWIQAEQQSGTTLWQSLGKEGEPPQFRTNSRDLYDRVKFLQLRERERQLIPPPKFLDNHPQINEGNRYELVEWMAEVNDDESFHLDEGTFHLAVNLVDRFLAFRQVHLKVFQLLGATAHFVASKFLETRPPRIKDFCKATDNAFNPSQVRAMEETLLNAVTFRLHVPTSLSFAAHYWNLLTTGTAVGFYLDSLEKVNEAWKQIVAQLRTQLLRSDYAERPPSQLAVIAISRTLFEKNVPEEVIGPTIGRLSDYEIVFRRNDPQP